MTDIKNIEQKLNIKFNNTKILEEAFIHPSFANASGVNSNQRLEFLGDSLVNLVVAKHLFDNFPSEQEGFLTVERAKIVSKEGLARVTESLGIIDYLKIGRGQEEVRHSDKVMCDLYEAVIGAIYIDSGEKAVYTFICETLKDAFLNVGNNDNIDYKSKLLEYGAQNNINIEFKLISKSGFSHSPMFEVEARCNGKNMGRATAGNKKQAEQIASQKALETLK